VVFLPNGSDPRVFGRVRVSELIVGIELSEIELTPNAEREPLGVAFFSGFSREF
jgi:hypothetical protein